MKQESIVRISNDDNSISLICNADTALGKLHDFLLSLKGDLVTRMNKAQAEEQAATDAVKEADAKKVEEKDEIVVEEVK